jgi:hypothetical protein
MILIDQKRFVLKQEKRTFFKFDNLYKLLSFFCLSFILNTHSYETLYLVVQMQISYVNIDKFYER